MSDLYNAAPGTYGGFTSPVPGGSSNKGFYQQPLNLPFHNGRSILATIPEYQRNPLALERDLLFKVSEGRSNFMKILLETIEGGGGHVVPDVRYRLPIEVEPLQRIYFSIQSVSAASSTGYTTFKVRGNTTKISTAMSGGNPKQVGDIARLEANQFIMLPFSWVEPRRTAAVAGSKLTYYSPTSVQPAPVPELGKIISVDYAKSTIKVERHWAGSQRTSSLTYTNIPAFSIVADGSSNTWQNTGGTATVSFEEKYAYCIPLAKSMKEDEIDAKVKNFSNTWTHGIVQRHLLAWGSQYFSEIISNNLGIESPLAKSKRYAIKDFYDQWEWYALFGEKSESFDPETGYWSGTTDGLLANIPKSHYVSIRGVDYASGFTAGASSTLGSFHPLIFNKLLEGKAYMGSAHKVLVCGSSFYTSFATMINFMTQNVPDIKSEWDVRGSRFTTSDGLVVDVTPSDKLSLNGFANSAVLYDKDKFKPVTLKDYPSADIYEVNNENPLKTNGFIHGVKSFIDLMPDAHWVFTVVDKTLPDGTDNTTAYNAISATGTYLA